MNLRAKLVFAVGILAVACLAVPGTVRASTITLNFEGLQNLEAVGSYYDGGFGSLGSGPGPSDGITFESDSLVLISAADGGTGDFTTLPSAGCTGSCPDSDSVAFFLSGAGDVMDVSGGFDTGFAFDYTSTSAGGSVAVWSGLDGTGTELASLNLDALGNCVSEGTSIYDFCNWAAVGVNFAGTAESVIFSGSANEIAFDDITLGSSTPGGVPEPSSLLLLGTGLLGMGIVALRRKELGQALTSRVVA